MSDGGGVRHLEITERETPVFDGAEFGSAGAYERLHGTAFCELDPAHNAERRHRQSRPRATQRTRLRRIPVRVPHPAAARSCPRQRLAGVRRAQPRQPADHAAAERRAGGRPSGARRQRLPDASRLHAGVERLAGRRAAGQRSPGRALSGCRGRHRHGARGVHRRGDRAARRRQHRGGVGGSLHRHAGLSGCRRRRGHADGARTRGRSARHAARPCVAADRRPPCRNHPSDRVRLRSRRDLRVHLPRARPDRDGHRLRRDPRPGVAPASHDAGDPAYAGLRHLAERPRAARSGLPRIQSGPCGAAGVRRHHAGGRRLPPHLHQLAVRPGRPLLAPARGPFVRRRPVPVQLSDAARSGQRPHRRHPATRPRCRRVPEGDAPGYRERRLAGTRLAGGDRHLGRRPSRCPTTCASTP